MQSAHITLLALTAAVVGLPACVSQPEDATPGVATAQIESGPCRNDLESWAVVIDGTPLDEILAQDQPLERLGSYLAEWEIDINDPALPERLASIKRGVAKSVDVPSAFTGLAGFHKIQIAELALALARGADFEQRRVICGKIRDYVYDESDGSGHLAVDTRVDIYDSAASFAVSAPDAVERYHWDIDILPGTYRVVQRGPDPDDPFPMTVALPAAAKNPGNPDGIWRRGGPPGLDHKLFAQGPGIKVRDVYQRFDDGSIVRLDPEHPYYVPTADSCIDLLTKHAPPATFADLPPQPGYCLGRCDHPQVVNTH